jgi:hypothetical protein
MEDNTIVINGADYVVDNVYNGSYLPCIETDGGEFYVAENIQAAGEAAREYWEDMVKNDPKEFRCMVGDETLVKWALGESAGPGSTQVNSLEEWLDLWLDTPEEQWASYDGEECDVTACSEDLIEELGFTPTVAYRCN